MFVSFVTSWLLPRSSHFTRAAERVFRLTAGAEQADSGCWNAASVRRYSTATRGRCVSPSRGAALVPHARSVLEAWEAGVAAVRAAEQTRHSTLIVGMSTSLGRDGLLPAIRSRFNDRLPSVTLKLHQVGWDDPTAGLGDGSTDVAFGLATAS